MKFKIQSDQPRKTQKKNTNTKVTVNFKFHQDAHCQIILYYLNFSQLIAHHRHNFKAFSIRDALVWTKACWKIQPFCGHECSNTFLIVLREIHLIKHDEEGVI